jgi:signal transduction histidine kinase
MLEIDLSQISLAFAAAVVALGMGVLSYWANPARVINRAFLRLSLHVALWLMTLEIALGGGYYGLLFLRLTTAIGCLLPAHLWLIKEQVMYPFTQGVLRRGWKWFLAGSVLAAICATNWFVPANSSAWVRVYGLGYYVVIVGILVMFFILWINATIQARALSGSRRIELQVLVLISCSAGFVVIALMTAGAVTKSSGYIHLQPIVILLAYGATAYAMFSSRLFDAAHLVAVTLHQAVLVSTVALTIWLVYLVGQLFMPDVLAYIAAVGLGMVVFLALDHRLRRLFRLWSSREINARKALYEVTREDLRPQALIESYERIIEGWAQTGFVRVLANERGNFESGSLCLRADSKEYVALHSLRWATPERLVRERHQENNSVLGSFMRVNHAGALVLGEGRELHVILMLGVPSSRMPYTYPQIRQLSEFAAIVQAGLEKAQLSVRARHSEQLATVGILGASLAHEIRNPLVTLKTFAQLFPDRYQDAAFRNKFQTLLTSEVARIEHLTEQLLDMSSLHNYKPQSISLNQVAESCLELISAQARSRDVELKSELEASPDLVMSDPHAARQVLLNLCLNGIQAMEAQKTPRWLLLSTRNLDGAVELSVTDNGPGIAPEMRVRLFHPFSTSKSSGFGLGLAICSDILSGLGASISADPSVPGRGATFRVLFPSAPRDPLEKAKKG